eukprot:CAMPEP_0195305730 /NCGR_PEP_ID=MMETSP0707-20130614/36834_1 /TAXON_ID=33640 /ORGANISM="Asterionellopsis glacialis, Strain CCMP134" /LENGTH=262 /DNA_ID=CAMNT_0040369929 /DNA_START=235 /DNA_END=1023 /DNA_ORIENTATION=+
MHASSSSAGDDHDPVPSPIVVEGPELPPILPTCKRLFLVRHGEVINPGGDRPVFYGALDVSLSPLGEAEAIAAGQYLAQYDLQYIAASPLSRAIFGANRIMDLQKNKEDVDVNAIKDNGSDIKIYEGFTELDRGEWCGLTGDEIGADNLAKFNACDESVTPKGGESYPFLKDRVLKARRELLDITDVGKASALVSHLQVTRCMISDAMGIAASDMASLKVSTASVTCIDYDMVTGKQTIHFQSFKPDVGLQQSNDGVNNFGY